MEQFSDRARENIPYGLANGPIYTQNFDNRHREKADQVDRVNVTFLKRSSDDYLVDFMYPRWGARGGVSVSLETLTDSKAKKPQSTFVEGAEFQAGPFVLTLYGIRTSLSRAFAAGHSLSRGGTGLATEVAGQASH